MISRDAFRSPAVRAASLVLGIATILLLWSVVRAFRAPAIPAMPTTSVATLEGTRRAPIRSPANIQAAVENDLFSPDRTAPTTPYRMPGEDAKSDKPVVEPMKPVVLGTAVASDGRSFATLQLGDASPTLVHVGDKIGEWIVRSIARGKVVLESTQGIRAELAVPHPGT